MLDQDQDQEMLVPKTRVAFGLHVKFLDVFQEIGDLE